MKRKCSSCNELLDISEYTKDAGYTGGYDKYCRICKSAINRRNYLKMKSLKRPETIDVERHNRIVRKLNEEYMEQIRQLKAEIIALRAFNNG